MELICMDFDEFQHYVCVGVTDTEDNVSNLLLPFLFHLLFTNVN
jgi:hypothetical protein